MLSIPEARIKSSKPFLLEPYRKRIKRAGCMSEFLHDPPAFVVFEREWHTYFYVGRRCLSCSTTTEHSASFVVIRTLTLLKLSSISNSRIIVTIVYACRYLLCVCVCACGIKETFVHLKCVFIFFFEFYTPMHVGYQYIVQSSVTSKTTHNLSHIDTTTTIQTIANTIMSRKLTDDTL